MIHKFEPQTEDKFLVVMMLLKYVGQKSVLVNNFLNVGDAGCW